MGSMKLARDIYKHSIEAWVVGGVWQKEIKESSDKIVIRSWHAASWRHTPWVAAGRTLSRVMPWRVCTAGTIKALASPRLTLQKVL